MSKLNNNENLTIASAFAKTARSYKVTEIYCHNFFLKKITLNEVVNRWFITILPLNKLPVFISVIFPSHCSKINLTSKLLEIEPVLIIRSVLRLFLFFSLGKFSVMQKANRQELFQILAFLDSKLPAAASVRIEPSWIVPWKCSITLITYDRQRWIFKSRFIRGQTILHMESTSFVSLKTRNIRPLQPSNKMRDKTPVTRNRSELLSTVNESID